MTRHRVQLPESLRWERIVGHEEAKQQLRGLIAALLDPDALARAGAAVPRGLILHGEPGTGKTLTARTFAVELNREARAAQREAVPFYEVAASDLSAERLGELGRWSSAQASTAVLYIDEIELWALDRQNPQHNPTTRASLFAALSAIDGIADTSRVVWIASVNRPPAQLDAALRRAGRLGYTIGFSAPDRHALEDLLGIEFGRRRVIGDIPMDEAVGLMEGATQAEVIQALDDGAMLSLGTGAEGLTWEHLRAAMLRRGRIFTPKVISPDIRWMIAVHEAAHAITGVHLFGGAGSVVSMQISEREFGGRTHFRHENESAHRHTGEHQLDQATVSLAGITAEGELVGRESMGAGYDVDAATEAVMTWIRFGVAPEWGRLAMDALDRQDRGPRLLDDYNAVTRMKVAECQHAATRLVSEHAPQILRLAELLNRVGSLAGTQLREALEEALAVQG